MLRKTVMAGLIAAVFSPSLVTAAEPTPEHTITGNVGVFSQYIFRGLTQTDRNPALQGGFDYAHKSGFYAGTWASNISWLKENASVNGGAGPSFISGTYQQGGSLEWDFYAGYKWSLPSDITLDLGTLYYWYPGKTSAAYGAATRAAMAPIPFDGAPRADTWEVYAGVAWKWLSAKYSYSIKDETFGALDSQGSWYLDLTANVPLGDFVKPLTGVTLIAHWGWQKYSGTDPRNVLLSRSGRGGPTAPYATTPDNDEILSYKDVKIGLSYALPKDFTVGAFYTKIYDENTLGYGGVGDQVTPGFFGPYPRAIGTGTATVFLQKTF